MFFSPFNCGEKWVLGSEPCAQHFRTLNSHLIKLRHQFKVERSRLPIDEIIRIPAFLSIRKQLLAFPPTPQHPMLDLFYPLQIAIANNKNTRSVDNARLLFIKDAARSTLPATS